MYIAIAAIVFIIIGLLLIRQAGKQRKTTGLPGGKVVYADTRKWGEVEEPLYDEVLDLVGRPDYLVKQRKMIIPVEVKSTQVAQSPYDSHIFQLAAYCYLVEQEYGTRPNHGLLHYPNRTYCIEYTSELEAELIKLVAEMRTKGHLKKINRSHQSQRRCASCGYRSNCDQSL
ncbi:MAG: CRISPR-associated protein Cas4 [Chloroflexota bacterium]|nr:CRISPR-associated protein Cas4 [Chloroflexota bacterium]